MSIIPQEDVDVVGRIAPYFVRVFLGRKLCAQTSIGCVEFNYWHHYDVLISRYCDYRSVEIYEIDFAPHRVGSNITQQISSISAKLPCLSNYLYVSPVCRQCQIGHEGKSAYVI